MTVVGMWLAIVGYGLAYAGASTLGGGNCSIIDAFQGKCGGLTSSSKPSGSTNAQRAAAGQAQQAAMIGTQPISQVA